MEERGKKAKREPGNKRIHKDDQVAFDSNIQHIQTHKWIKLMDILVNSLGDI